jgi:hypothetical protein
MDFITALGRLLHDEQLLDAFGAQPQEVATHFGLLESDRHAFLSLSVSDLEFQAGILLRKRFDLIKHIIPRTLGTLGERGRPAFLRYARNHWPAGPNKELLDAAGFCRSCEGEDSKFICQREWNRLNFALGRQRFAILFVRDVNIRNRNRKGLQIFVRLKAAHWREFFLFPCL